MKQHNEKFITYELSPITYTNKDIAKAVYTKGDHEGALQIEFDHISIKTKLVVTRFGGTFGSLRFDKKSFFIHYWDFHLIGIINLLIQFILMGMIYILVIKF